MARRRIALFLHGIECWTEIDTKTGKLLDQVDVFLSNSEYTWEQFIAINSRWCNRPHYVVSLGIGAPVTTIPRTDGVPAALIVGRMDRAEAYKGHRELIEAWPRVLARIPNAELWIVGGGDLRPELEGVVRNRSLSERVRFFGSVPDSKKESLIAHSTCLAMPSRGEGFGLVYLEAMRFGRPCLIHSTGAAAEVISPPEAGLAVDVGDIPELASTLTRLLTRGPEWQRLSEQARTRYETHFTARQFQKRLHECLESLAR